MNVEEVYTIESLREELPKISPKTEGALDEYLALLDSTNWFTGSSLWDINADNQILYEYYWNPDSGDEIPGAWVCNELYAGWLDCPDEWWEIVEALKDGSYANREDLFEKVASRSEQTSENIEDELEDGITLSALIQSAIGLVKNLHTNDEIIAGAWKDVVRPDTDVSVGRNGEGD